jgi:hypothetical protein
MCSDIISIAFRPRRSAISALTKCGIIFAAAIVLAACGLQRDAPRCRSHHDAARRAASLRCTPSLLRVRLDAHTRGVAAHTEYVPLDFTNSSAGLSVDLPSRTGLRGQTGQPIAIFTRHPVLVCARMVNGVQVLTVEPARSGEARRGGGAVAPPSNQLEASRIIPGR